MALPALHEATITIVGLGLMGGSLGIAIRQRGICRRVLGLARRRETIAEALTMGAIDEGGLSPAEALAPADIVVFCTPVRTIIRQLHDFSFLFKPGAIVTDLGSTKTQLQAVMEELPSHVMAVGSHPMCGKESNGLEFAEGNLYIGAPWVIVPNSHSQGNSMEIITSLAQAVGAKPIEMDARRHDRIVAGISHLPYLLAAALVLAAEKAAVNDELTWKLAASGFMDTSRLAASETHMMLDILLTNRGAIIEMLQKTEQELQHITRLMADGKEEPLQNWMSAARERRQKLKQEKSAAPES
jgi:prephenate dehydrogenase